MSLNNPQQIEDTLDDGYVTGVVTVGTSEVEAKAGTSVLDGRNFIMIQNKSSNTVYYGPTGLTVSNGIPIKKNQFVSFPVSDNISVYLISGSVGNDVIVQELG